MDYRSFEVTEVSVVGHYDEELTLKAFFNRREFGIEMWKLVYEFRGTPIGQRFVRVSHRLATTEVSDILIKTAPEWKKKADRMAANTQREIRVIRPSLLGAAGT